MRFKEYRNSNQTDEQLDEALTLATIISAAKILSGLLGTLLVVIVKEFTPEDWRILRVLFVKWIDKILSDKKKQQYYDLSPEQIKKTKEKMKKLSGKLEVTSGEKLIIDMYLNRLDRLEKRRLKREDALLEIKEIIYDFRNSYKEWEAENALDYK